MFAKTASLSSAIAGLMLTHVIGANPALAGHITLRGSANIGHKPEYMEITVKVESLCYPTSGELRKATNGAASAIRQVMQRAMNTEEGSRDEIIALPGEVKREDVIRYIEGRSVELCKKGWQGENSLILKLANQESWSQLQVAMLEVSDRYSSMETGPARTNLTISQPRPQLYPETLEQMKKAADEKAIVDATEKFKNIKDLCALGNCQLDNIAPVGNVIPVAYARAERVAMNDDNFQPEYGNIYVRASWDVQWAFTEQSGGMGALREELSEPNSMNSVSEHFKR